MNNAEPCNMPDPVTPFAEVETLRAEVVRLNAYWHETNVAWFSALVRRNDTDLVTVRREDLEELVESAYAHLPDAQIKNILKHLEESAK